MAGCREESTMSWEHFIKNNLPTRKDERWKYADLSFLANKNFAAAKRVDDEILIDAINQHRLRQGDNILLVFVNGYFMPSLSDLHKLPLGVIASDLNYAAKHHAETMEMHWKGDIDTKKFPFAGLNAEMCTDGLFLQLPDHCELATPIHVLSIVVDDAEFIAHPWHTIVLGEQSKLVLIEEYFSLAEQPYMMNVVTTINVGKGATLEHYKIQQEGKRAIHMANTFVKQKQDSNVSFANFAMGSEFARDDVIVRLQESGANCKTAGFYHLYRDNQFVDHHVDIDHIAPASQSEMLYKGILEQKSRAVFNGRVHVHKDAQKTLAYQANHNLLLSNDAEVYSKPELEIYADDVKCKHGATTGQIDQEALFYMRSRGISYAEAMNILLLGFAEEIMQRISHPGVKMRVTEMCYLNNRS